MQRRATYRLQLRAEFDFAAAAAQVDYLAALGVSHVYFSPYLQAAAGSTHGYDVVDPTRVSDDLGGPDAHRALCNAVRDAGLGQLLDIVPNHMSVADRRNRWWWDVLADGRESPYAAFFDIDWEVDEPRLHHRVLLPILGDQVGRVLEQGEIRLVREDGTVLISYFDHRYPLRVETVGGLLARVHAARPLVDRIAALPTGGDDTARRRRFEARVTVSEEISRLLTADASVAAALDDVLAGINSDIAALDTLLNEQHHRLARWQTATEEINYRRFFDITALVALRIEDRVVFEEVTTFVAGLVASGDVDGLRVDHIDGLRLPLDYAHQLRERTGAAAWLLTEKILARDERPQQWPVDGTSGYDFLALVNGLFVDPDGREPLTALHTEITGREDDFERVALDGKREILRTTLVADVERITQLLATVCDAYPSHRDHTHSELSEALVELIAAVPVYRTYVDPRTGAASDTDAGLIRGAAAGARNNAPDVDHRLLDFIADLFVFGASEDVATVEHADIRAAQQDMVLRLQQLCAATAAKGVEDTACYRLLVLTSLNEVGDSPAVFGVSAEEFHERNAVVQAQRPLTMLATSTHDTKRSEDVRCRIDVLSEMPGEWAATVHRWRAMNAVHRTGDVPDASMEYLLYQTLVGAAPVTTERAVAYMEKAAHEAKLQTSWLHPDEAYDTALRDFTTAVLADERFVADLEAVVGTLLPYARTNSLAMTLLKLTSPGVPDIYQGCELWDLSLVDPDNRRPVDYARRRALLEASAGRTPADAWQQDPDSGAAKQWLIATALRLRARLPHAFGIEGTYTPMHAAGRFSDDVLAFGRGTPAAVIAIAQRRSLRRRGAWGDTMIPLPDGDWHNLCDGTTSRGGAVALSDLLARFPVALLERAP